MAYIYDLSDTWNAAGTTFFGIKMNVTNSASASGSKLLSLQVASTEYFGVDKNGNVTIGNGGDLRISSATGGDDSIIYNDAEDLYFNTNGAVRAVINSSGNVGIGTASPLSKATVSQSGTVKLSLESQGSWNAGVGADASGNLLFYNPLATERMRIDSSGNVGVGTSSPKTRLQASAATTKNAPTLGSATDAPFYLSNSDTAYGLVIGNSSADGRVWFQAQRTDSSATAYNITLNEAGGQVLVGTASAFDNVSYLKFQSLGGVSTKIGGTSLTSQMSFFNDNGRVGWIGTDGTTTSYNTSSDARLKENIANADDASSLIDAIQVRKFDWKADGSHQRYGFIAQELIEVAPEAVSAPPEADQMMAVDYSKLVPMLVKELQSVRARLAALEGN